MSRNGKFGTVVSALLVIFITAVLVTPGAARSKYKTLHRFTGGADGRFPSSVLIFDQAGNLYGTTASGGSSNRGVVFKLMPKSGGRWTEHILYNFAGGSDGANPCAGVVFDGAGNLYGTTYNGGPDDDGTVFKLTPNADGSWSEIVLYSFTGDYGANPNAGVIFDAAGSLYSTTYNGAGGAGGVFKLTPNHDGTWSASVLYAFCPRGNCSDGASPLGGLIFDGAGNLYGTTAQGGVPGCYMYGCGVVFELTHHSDGSWTESALHRFNGVDGNQPLSSLVFDSAGNLYGTTALGGNSPCYEGLGCGVVFQLRPNRGGGWTENILHMFNGGDGAEPVGGLIFDTASNLYSTTFTGGDYFCAGGCGVVFKLAHSKGGWQETVLHYFFDHPGTDPQAGVTFDAAGNLFGTTLGDGSTTFGSVFEITP